MFKMFYGKNTAPAVEPGELNIPGVVAVAALLVIITVTGLFIPNEMKTLLNMAEKIIIGG